MVTQVGLLSKILALLETSNTNSSPAEKARFLAGFLRYRAPVGAYLCTDQQP
jgi:hypothetical protein